MLDIVDLNHTTIVSRDVESSRRFYCDVLGMEQIETPSAFTHTTVWFRRGSAEIHLVALDDASHLPGDPPNREGMIYEAWRCRHFAFAVSDIDAAAKSLVEQGIKIELGPRDRGDGVIQMFIYDPDGHLIELHTIP